MNINDFDRVIAIGDCHGHYDKLQDIWNKIKLTDNDLAIFLGDYIDRGNDSLKCLDFVMSLSKKDNVIALMGNHEAFMRDYFSGDIDRTSYDIWLDPRNGGDVTHEQFINLSDDDKIKYYNFIASLPVYHKMDNYLFVHAGIYPEYDLSEQTEEDMLWIRDEFFKYYKGDDIIVVGHTPTPYLGYDTPIKLKNNIIMVDTGAAMDKKMSAIDVKTMKFVQSI